MLVVQCLLAVLVVLSDLPQSALSLPGLEPDLPPADVPVSPGNQTREFQPGRLPTLRPEGPGFPADGIVPRRLEFTGAEVEGYNDAVLVTGTIAEGDAARFEDWLGSRETPPDAFVLHSPGGSVAEALRIGRAIRATGLPVVLPEGNACFSACPYILAGGTTREVSAAALVGVHQHYFGENTFLPAFLMVSDVQAGQAEVMTYLDEMGIDPLVMSKAMITPPDEIYILLPDELQSFGLATDLLDGPQTAG